MNTVSIKPDFKSLFESAPALLLVLDVNFNIIAANDNYVAATMIKREEVLGKYIFDVFPNNPDDPETNSVAQLEASLKKVVKTKTADVMAFQKYDVKNPQGIFEEKYWSPVNTPVLNSKGEIDYIIHKVEDVTDFVNLKNEKARIKAKAASNTLSDEQQVYLEKVQQSQRLEAMGQLAGGVAHDFNNILTTIILLGEDLLNNPAMSEGTKKSVLQILKGSEKAKSLTRQLLAFSRKQILTPTTLNLTYVVEDMRDLLNHLLDERFDLVIDVEKNLKNITIDPAQVEQLLINFLVNARDAMPTGGRINLNIQNEYVEQKFSSNHLTVEAGHYVVLTIKDEGIGMDLKTQARIFEPFFTTKEIGQGTGLGLSMIYGIIQNCEGTIKVISELGKGALFKVYFPAVDKPISAQLNTSDRDESNSNSISGKKILLVEDEIELRQALGQVLTSVGYAIHEAENGKEALDILTNKIFEPDLIISDVMMPKMTGPVMAQKLGELGRQEKILFLSGYVDDFLNVNQDAIAKHHFLEKPFQIAALTKKIGQILN
jgi:PAS domain S-box-containing protein